MPKQQWNEWKERVYETRRIILHDECGGDSVFTEGDKIVSALFDDGDAILVIRHTEDGKTTDIHNVIHRSDIKEIIY